MKTKHFLKVILILFTLHSQAQSELYVDTTITVEQMVMDFFNGDSINISNVTYSGNSSSRGYFEGANTDIGIPGGILMSSGFADRAIGPNNNPGFGGLVTGGGDDPNLAAIANGMVEDASVIEFNMVSNVNDTLYFSYVFASEEYPEYTCSDFNDVFGFFVTGPNPAGGNYEGDNIALIPDVSDPSGLTFTDFPVTINNVNSGIVGSNGNIASCTPPLGSLEFSEYYVDNIVGDHIQYDGFTVELYAPLAVLANESYHIKIGVADVQDGAYDSAVFLGVESLNGDSLITPPSEALISINGNTITLANESRYATSYLWNFGDGSSSQAKSPMPHTYNQDGYYTVSLVTQNYCCSDTFTTVIPIGDVTSVDTDFCDIGYFNLSGLAPEIGQEGNWTVLNGNGILNNSSNPNSILNEPSIGLNVLEWKITEISSGNQIFADTFVLNIYDLPQVNIATEMESFCENDTPFQLNGLPSGGLFNGVGVSGNNFDPVLAGIGSHVISYNYTDENGCFNVATSTMDVLTLPDVEISFDSESYCENDAPVQLSGFPIGGTFAGVGVLGESFDPFTAGIGNHEISYDYIDNNGCNNSDTSIIEVLPTPVVDFTIEEEFFCENDDSIQLSGTPIGGTFTGPGVNGEFFNPASAGPGNHMINYDYTGTNGCSNSSSVNVEVAAVPITPEIILIGNDSLYCTVSGDVYIWELNGNAISANSQQILLEVDGTYTVSVIQSGCSSEPSEAFLFTGIFDVLKNAENSLKVLPNPTNDFIQIQIDDLEQTGIVETLKIFNVQGQIILQFSNFPVTNNINFDVNDLKSGIYFIQIIQKGDYFSGSFIKQ